MGHAAVAEPRPVRDLVLVEEPTFNVAADGSIDFTVQLPGTLTSTDLSAATMVVTSYQGVTTRAAVEAAVNDKFSRAIDSVDLPINTLTQTVADQFTVSIPVESSTLTPPALNLPLAGLYPVVIEIRLGSVTIADLTTFVHRLPAADDQRTVRNLAVAVAIAPDPSVTLADGGAAQLDADQLARLQSLADSLEASAVHIAVQVPPRLLAGLTTADPTLDARLKAALQRNDLLSAPTLPLDPSSASAAKRNDLYGQWLRDGEDALAAATSTTAQRTTSIIDQPLSVGGAELLRDLGVRMIALDTNVFTTLVGNPGSFTDTTQIVQLQLGSDTFGAIIPDRPIAPMLTTTSADPQLRAIEIVALILAQADEVAGRGDDPSRHGMLLAAEHFASPAPAVLAPLTSLLTTTPGIAAVSIDELSVRTSTLRIGGRIPPIALPDEAGADISSRMATYDVISLDAASTASMLDPADPVIATWSASTAPLASDAVSEAQATRIATAQSAQFAAVRSAVQVPAPFSINLTGEDSVIPLTFQNTGDRPLTVRIELGAAAGKLQFPNGIQTEQLTPNSSRTINVKVKALSRGRFPVILRVTTPVGTALTPSADGVSLTATVNSLRGLGNLITGGFLLVVLTWWVRHMRRTRLRAHAAARAASERHPVNGAAAPATATTTARTVPEPDELSPDAATSTLPPS